MCGVIVDMVRRFIANDDHVFVAVISGDSEALSVFWMCLLKLN